MKKLFLLMALMVALPSLAATHYRDRIVPGGVCMVKFSDTFINANLIQEVKAGNFPDSEYIGFFEGRRHFTYTAFRVTLVNGKAHEVKTDLPTAETMNRLFLQMVKDECK